MRHEAICNYLEAEADLHRAEALLDDLEPSSGARAALIEKVAELRLTAISLAIKENAEQALAEIEQSAPSDKPAPSWNGRGVFFSILFCVASWVGIYPLSSALLRRFAA
jgi:hypothetical protein